MAAQKISFFSFKNQEKNNKKQTKTTTKPLKMQKKDMKQTRPSGQHLILWLSTQYSTMETFTSHSHHTPSTLREPLCRKNKWHELTGSFKKKKIIKKNSQAAAPVMVLQMGELHCSTRLALVLMTSRCTPTQGHNRSGTVPVGEEEKKRRKLV